MMKITIKHLAIGAIALASAMTGYAQTTRTGYFLDDYTYRFEMNPAYANSKNFVSMPLLANMNLGINGNMALDQFLYVRNGKTVTFLSPLVSTQEAMKNINETNRLNENYKLNVISAGFKAFKGYNTISINIRQDLHTTIPGAALRLMKEGIANKNYRIANFHVNAVAYGEIALNHSHQINKEWRVGGTLKLLAGVGAVDADINRADLDLGENDWRIISNANIRINASKNLAYKTKISDATGRPYVSGIDGEIGDVPGLNGLGGALDLGAVYTPAFLPGLEISASVTDLGFIKWNNDLVASTNGTRTFNTDKYTFNVDKESVNSFDNQWDKIKDDLTSLTELDDMGNVGSRTMMLGTTVNVGAKYPLPVWKKLTFGLLNTTRIQKNYTWTDFRLSANIAPCKVFDAALSANAGTFGVGWGMLLNLHCPGFNLFMGCDRLPCKFAKYEGAPIPMTYNFATNFGLNFLF